MTFITLCKLHSLILGIFLLRIIRLTKVSKTNFNLSSFLGIKLQTTTNKKKIKRLNKHLSVCTCLCVFVYKNSVYWMDTDNGGRIMAVYYQVKKKDTWRRKAPSSNFFQKLKSFSTSCVSLSTKRDENFHLGFIFEQFDSKVSNFLANQQHQEEVQLFLDMHKLRIHNKKQEKLLFLDVASFLSPDSAFFS